jgi:hypothetical protein
MSITSRMCAAITGIAFGLLALGTMASAGGVSPASTTVDGDTHWSQSQSASELASVVVADDTHWR